VVNPYDGSTFFGLCDKSGSQSTFPISEAVVFDNPKLSFR
jgi:hypothetical protein